MTNDHLESQMERIMEPEMELLQKERIIPKVPTMTLNAKKIAKGKCYIYFPLILSQ